MYVLLLWARVVKVVDRAKKQKTKPSDKHHVWNRRSPRIAKDR